MRTWGGNWGHDTDLHRWLHSTSVVPLSLRFPLLSNGINDGSYHIELL